jgi:hypothetical protein
MDELTWTHNEAYIQALLKFWAVEYSTEIIDTQYYIRYDYEYGRRRRARRLAKRGGHSYSILVRVWNWFAAGEITFSQLQELKRRDAGGFLAS